MSSNFNNIISVLDTINKNATVPVYIPSLKREVKFKNLNTGQQKNLLKAAVDNPVFQTRFTIALYNIIVENCTEKDILISLTTIDSAAIAVQLKIAASGATYTLNQNDKKYKIDLQSVVDKFKASSTLDPETISDTPFTVQVGMPLFVEQYNLEKQLREKDLNDQQVVNTQLTETIGDAFIGEVSKFIKEISVFHDNTDESLGYKSLPFTKRHTILEKIPTTVIKNVLNYMEKYVSIQKDILTVTGTDIDTEETVSDLLLSIDTTLFVVN